MDNYELERDRLKRRRAVSDALMMQSMQPMGGTEVVNGIAVRRSPLEGVAKLGQAYFSKQRNEGIDADERGLLDRNRADIAAAIGDYTKATTARPESIAGDEIGDWPVYTPAFTPTQADKTSAAMNLMGKVGDPKDAAKLLVAEALKPKELKAFKPGDVLYNGDQPTGTTVPRQPDWKPHKKPTANGGEITGVIDMNAANPLDTFKEDGRLNPQNQVGPGGQVFNAREVKPGTVLDDPNKPFRLVAGEDGAPPTATPNLPFQTYETGKARAGAPQVNVHTEKQFLGEIGQKLGADIATATANARGAVGTLNTVNQIREALDSGAVVAGPGATPQMVLMQIGQRLAPGGEPSEQMVKTRQAIQGLAQLELDAAAQMKGQGQITESERGIIRRAASGDIDGMTVPELRVLTDTLDKTARYKIRANQANVQRLRTNPSAASMVEFMNVEEPAPYTPRSGGGGGGLSPAERTELEELRRRTQRR